MTPPENTDTPNAAAEPTSEQPETEHTDEALEPAREKIDEDQADAEHAAEALNEAEREGTEDLAAVKAKLEEEAALIAEAKPILLRDFNGKIALEGGWPELAAIAPVLLTQEFTLVEGPKLTITLVNARAAYEFACKDGRIAIYRLTDDHTGPALAPSLQVGSQTSTQVGGPLDPTDAATKDGAAAEPQTQTSTGSSEKSETATNEDGRTGSSEPLRDDGPTLEQWVKAGYSEANYPPRGYARRDTPYVPPEGEPDSKPRSSQGVVTEPAEGPNPNVKCPECQMFGNRHRPTCSRGGPG